MRQKYQKSKLVRLTKTVEKEIPLTPAEMDYLLGFEKKTDKNKLQNILTKAALPVSLALGFFYNVFPDTFNNFIKSLPVWTNLPSHLLTGVDYLWDLLGEPVGRANIV